MFNRLFASWRGTSWEMSRGMENFIAGGMGSNLYWLMALRESSSYPPESLAGLGRVESAFTILPAEWYPMPASGWSWRMS